VCACPAAVLIRLCVSALLLRAFAVRLRQLRTKGLRSRVFGGTKLLQNLTAEKLQIFVPKSNGLPSLPPSLPPGTIECVDTCM
jgi:hypothetical protein